MPSMTDISSQTLHLVAKELAATLGDARTSLEAYAERPDQRALLEKCAEHLHLAHGVLRLVEVYGAALLAEEMEQVTRYLLDAGNDQKRQIDGLDALMRSMVQLPTYLERVLSGGRDLALVLLPLLNDLRSVRGSPLLSEGTLLLLNLKSDQAPQPSAPRQGEAPITVTQWARRLRPRFQVGLLGYIRGERVEQNLDILAKVAEKMEQVATSQPVFQFWWVTGAILEALRTRGLEASATLKRLLGQADRQIKLLYEIGEARYCDNVLRGALEHRRRPYRRGAGILQIVGAPAGGRFHRARAREPVRTQRQADAHGCRGHQGGSLQGQGCARHLRAARRRAHR
jgi:chemosensory pili system protein ChpA (sensor histidine kinase/response regulator)